MAFIVGARAVALACIFNVVIALGYGNTAGYSHFTSNKGLVLDQQLS